MAQALTYFCIYVVRQGVTSWFVFYLMKVSTPLKAPSIFSLASQPKSNGFAADLLTT